MVAAPSPLAAWDEVVEAILPRLSVRGRKARMEGLEGDWLERQKSAVCYIFSRMGLDHTKYSKDGGVKLEPVGLQEEAQEEQEVELDWQEEQEQNQEQEWEQNQEQQDQEEQELQVLQELEQEEDLLTLEEHYQGVEVGTDDKQCINDARTADKDIKDSRIKSKEKHKQKWKYPKTSKNTNQESGSSSEDSGEEKKWRRNEKKSNSQKRKRVSYDIGSDMEEEETIKKKKKLGKSQVETSLLEKQFMKAMGKFMRKFNSRRS